MNNVDFYSPTYFVFGRDRENEAGKYVKKFGGSRVMIVYGGQSAKKFGVPLVRLIDVRRSQCFCQRLRRTCRLGLGLRKGAIRPHVADHKCRDKAKQAQKRRHRPDRR